MSELHSRNEGNVMGFWSWLQRFMLVLSVIGESGAAEHLIYTKIIVRSVRSLFAHREFTWALVILAASLIQHDAEDYCKCIA